MRSLMRLTPRERRHHRLRKTLRGDGERPRLAVYRSLKHIGGQIIDDDKGSTLVGVSSSSKLMRTSLKHGGSLKAAQVVGEAIAKQAVGKGITRVVFDRGGYIYHGRVKAFAEAARKAGLQF